MITPLPNPPLVTDSPTDFQNKASAFLGALPTFAIEANADIAGITNTSATAMWVATTTYSRGNVVWSPATYLNYRLKSTSLTGGAGNADPSVDTTNWAQATGTGNVSAGTSPSFTNLTATGNVGIGTSSPGAKLEAVAGTGQQTLGLFRTGDATAANNAGGGFTATSSATAGSRFAQVWLDADGANFSGGDYFYINKIGNSGNVELIQQSAAAMTFQTTGTERMRIDSSGNVGIGTSAGITTVSSGLAINNATAGNFPGLEIQTAGVTRFYINANNAASYISSQSTNPMVFQTNGSERMRIDSSGNLLVGTTSAINGSGCPIQALTTAANQVMYLRNSNAVPNGMFIDYSGAAPNNTISFFADFRDTGGQRFGVRSNGGIANYSANNVNLSDERTKTDIQDAGNYLAKICSIPVRTFKYKDQSDDILNLGVIAQEVEAVAPDLVDVSGFGETPEDGVPLKAIYQTDLQYALMKCIQEQQAIIEQLKADVAALKGKV
jgi:hypothetical protein